MNILIFRGEHEEVGRHGGHPSRVGVISLRASCFYRSLTILLCILPSCLKIRVGRGPQRSRGRKIPAVTNRLYKG